MYLFNFSVSYSFVAVTEIYIFIFKMFISSCLTALFASRSREYRDNSTLDHFRLLNRPCEKPSDWDLNDLKTEKDNPSPQIAERFVGKQTAWTIDKNLPRSFHLLPSKYRVPRSKCFKCNCFLNCWRWCFRGVKSLNKETDYVRRSIWIDNPHE